MTKETELKLCRLYEGLTVKQVLHRLDIASKHIQLKQLQLRHKLIGLQIGD